MTNIIPESAGINPVNGLIIQRVVCIVFDAKTLNIIAAAETHNKADELACDYFRKGVDALAEEVRFDSDALQGQTIIGMNLMQFEWFRDKERYNFDNLGGA